MISGKTAQLSLIFNVLFKSKLMFYFFLQWNNSGAVSIGTDSANNSSQFTKEQTDCGSAFLQVSIQYTI